MWLRVLRLGGCLGLSAWPLNTITSVPVRETGSFDIKK